MKLTVNRPVEIEAVAIKCELPVRYCEEDIPNDFPLRRGDVWIGIIYLDTGVIRDWPTGRSGKMCMKVCDEGTYSLMDASGKVLAERVNEYVPSCIPGEWGDYVNFYIDATGKIANWSMACNPESVQECFFPDD
jgi:hypothetical protein